MSDKLLRCKFKVMEILHSDYNYNSIMLRVYAVHDKREYILTGYGHKIVKYCLDNLNDLKVLCKDVSPVDPNPKAKNPITELEIVDIIKE